MNKLKYIIFSILFLSVSLDIFGMHGVGKGLSPSPMSRKQQRKARQQEEIQREDVNNVVSEQKSSDKSKPNSKKKNNGSSRRRSKGKRYSKGRKTVRILNFGDENTTSQNSAEIGSSKSAPSSPTKKKDSDDEEQGYVSENGNSEPAETVFYFGPNCQGPKPMVPVGAITTVSNQDALKEEENEEKEGAVDSDGYGTPVGEEPSTSNREQNGEGEEEEAVLGEIEDEDAVTVLVDGHAVKQEDDTDDDAEDLFQSGEKRALDKPNKEETSSSSNDDESDSSNSGKKKDSSDSDIEEFDSKGGQPVPTSWHSDGELDKKRSGETRKRMVDINPRYVDDLFVTNEKEVQKLEEDAVSSSSSSSSQEDEEDDSNGKGSKAKQPDSAKFKFLKGVVRRLTKDSSSLSSDEEHNDEDEDNDPKDFSDETEGTSSSSSGSEEEEEDSSSSSSDPSNGDDAQKLRAELIEKGRKNYIAAVLKKHQGKVKFVTPGDEELINWANINPVEDEAGSSSSESEEEDGSKKKDTKVRSGQGSEKDLDEDSSSSEDESDEPDQQPRVNNQTNGSTGNAGDHTINSKKPSRLRTIRSAVLAATGIGIIGTLVYKWLKDAPIFHPKKRIEKLDEK